MVDVSDIKVESLILILCKNKDTQEVSDFFRTLGALQEIGGPYSDDTVYHSWKRHGISVRLESGIVSGIFLYSDGCDNFSQYRGELPEKLSFSETRKSIEERLGKPEVSGGNGRINFWTSYDNLNLGITYKTLDSEDMSATISCIQIRPRRI